MNYDNLREEITRVISLELNEYKYLNLWADEIGILKGDIKMRDKYAQEVWDVLNQAYSSIGGCKTFDDIDEMKRKANFWKLKIRNGIVSAVSLYNVSENGRKCIAAGARKADNRQLQFTYNNDLVKIVRDDMNDENRHAWSEISGAMEKIARKNSAAYIPIDIVRKLIPTKTLIPVSKGKENEVVDDISDMELSKNPTLDGYHYARNIGGHLHRKIAMGHPIVK